MMTALQMNTKTHKILRVAFAIAALSIAILMVVYPFLYPAKSISHDSNISPEYRAKRDKQLKLNEEAQIAWKQEHNLPKAEKLFREALSVRQRGYIFINEGLAHVLHEQGKEAEAFEYLDQVINPPKTTGGTPQTDPKNVRLYVELCEKLGHQEKAYLAIKRMVDSWLPLMQRRYSQLKGKELQESEVYALGKMMLASSAEDGKALDFLREAINLAPHLTVLHYSLAEKLKRLGEYKESRAIYETVLRMCPAEDWEVKGLAENSIRELGYKIEMIERNKKVASK